MKINKLKTIRQKNRSLILNFLKDNPGSDKTTISKKINCSRQTVSKIVKNLIDEDLVIKDGIGNSTKEGGKRPILLSYNQKGRYVIGAMLLRDKVKAKLTELGANIIVERSILNFNERKLEDKITSIIELFEEMITESGIERKRLLGIGIGVQGIVNFDEGIIKMIPNQDDWANVPLASYVEDKLGYKVFIDNESRMRGYGEKWIGLAKNIDNFLIISVNETLNAGVFINGKCIRGTDFLAGEIGHMKLDKKGPNCVCGNKGCFEAFVNLSGIRNIFDRNSSLEEYKDSLFARKFKGNNNKIMISELFNHFHKGDKLAKLIVDEISYWFGVGIANIISIIDPKLIIIHGQYILGGDYFKNKIIETINKEFLLNIQKENNIEYSKLGGKAGLYGAAGIVVDKLLLNCETD